MLTVRQFMLAGLLEHAGGQLEKDRGILQRAIVTVH
jgi:hypothetical protein